MFTLVTFLKIKIEIWGKLHLKDNLKSFTDRSYFLEIDTGFAEIGAKEDET